MRVPLVAVPRSHFESPLYLAGMMLQALAERLAALRVAGELGESDIRDFLQDVQAATAEVLAAVNGAADELAELHRARRAAEPEAVAK